MISFKFLIEFDINQRFQKIILNLGLKGANLSKFWMINFRSEKRYAQTTSKFRELERILNLTSHQKHFKILGLQVILGILRQGLHPREIH
jgi:hypothetical protein